MLNRHLDQSSLQLIVTVTHVTLSIGSNRSMLVGRFIDRSSLGMPLEYFLHRGRPPLQDAVDELAAQTAADGSLGMGTDRYLAATQPTGPPPHGAAWRTVRVIFPR